MASCTLACEKFTGSSVAETLPKSSFMVSVCVLMSSS
jgi:hypothetical protein